MSPKADRRGTARIRVKLHARYRSDSVLLDGWVENLSSGGLFLRSDFVDAAGRRASLRLTLPGEPAPIHAEVEVVRVHAELSEPGMGIRFVDISPRERRRLANFMIERHHEAHLAGHV